MVLKLVEHVRARTRSVQLDKSTACDSSRRYSSLPGTVDIVVHKAKGNSRSTSEAFSDSTVTVRRYKSMLDVDDAPKIGPNKPISYEDLYQNTQHSTPPPIKHRRSESSQKPQVANQPAMVDMALPTAPPACQRTSSSLCLANAYIFN
ncbi:hypothetical protein CTA2_11222, partial [Colletotrichum tanaceti]